MLYTRKSFTLPTQSSDMTQRDWDRVFLTPEEFVVKYGCPLRSNELECTEG